MRASFVKSLTHQSIVKRRNRKTAQKKKKTTTKKSNKKKMMKWNRINKTNQRKQSNVQPQKSSTGWWAMIRQLPAAAAASRHMDTRPHITVAVNSRCHGNLAHYLTSTQSYCCCCCSSPGNQTTSPQGLLRVPLRCFSFGWGCWFGGFVSTIIPPKKKDAYFDWLVVLFFFFFVFLRIRIIIFLNIFFLSCPGHF